MDLQEPQIFSMNCLVSSLSLSFKTDRFANPLVQNTWGNIKLFKYFFGKDLTDRLLLRNHCNRSPNGTYSITRNLCSSKVQQPTRDTIFWCAPSCFICSISCKNSSFCSSLGSSKHKWCSSIPICCASRFKNLHSRFKNQPATYLALLRSRSENIPTWNSIAFHA